MIRLHTSHEYYFSLFFNMALVYTVHHVPRNTSTLWEVTMYLSLENTLNFSYAKEKLSTKKISSFHIYPLK